MTNELMMLTWLYTPEMKASAYKCNVTVAAVIVSSQGLDPGAGTMSATAEDQAMEENEHIYEYCLYLCFISTVILLRYTP